MQPRFDAHLQALLARGAFEVSPLAYSTCVLVSRQWHREACAALAAWLATAAPTVSSAPSPPRKLRAALSGWQPRFLLEIEFNEGCGRYKALSWCRGRVKQDYCTLPELYERIARREHLATAAQAQLQQTVQRLITVRSDAVEAHRRYREAKSVTAFHRAATQANEAQKAKQAKQAQRVDRWWSEETSVDCFREELCLAHLFAENS